MLLFAQFTKKRFQCRLRLSCFVSLKVDRNETATVRTVVLKHHLLFRSVSGSFRSIPFHSIMYIEYARARMLVRLAATVHDRQLCSHTQKRNGTAQNENATERYGTTLEMVTERHVNYRFTKRNRTLTVFFMRTVHMHITTILTVVAYP